MPGHPQDDSLERCSCVTSVCNSTRCCPGVSGIDCRKPSIWLSQRSGSFASRWRCGAVACWPAQSDRGGDAVRRRHRGIELENQAVADRVSRTGAAWVTAQPGARRAETAGETFRRGPDDLLVEDNGLPLLVGIHYRHHARKLPGCPQLNLREPRLQEQEIRPRSHPKQPSVRDQHGPFGFVHVWRLHLFVTSGRTRDQANSMFASSGRTRLAPGT